MVLGTTAYTVIARDARRPDRSIVTPPPGRGTLGPGTCRTCRVTLQPGSIVATLHNPSLMSMRHNATQLKSHCALTGRAGFTTHYGTGQASLSPIKAPLSLIPLVQLEPTTTAPIAQHLAAPLLPCHTTRVTPHLCSLKALLHHGRHRASHRHSSRSRLALRTARGPRRCSNHSSERFMKPVLLIDYT
ncbi:hypothetical protein GWK47_007636 [Chionoecetes opilio]|uniref:Uncharacterized protein n=1 Tax=Chionoecetes opilio TaxID=41210 RepID=A0A8J4YBU4_CHIOP|nr:hypothetical protein GWK47_007636 [Chionoecetes opilio]